MQSDDIKELATNLALFQGKISSVKKDAINPYFKSKYATLDTIWNTIRKPLVDSGLSLVQTMGISDDGGSTLSTTLLHNSGQWISGCMKLNPVKEDPQGLGSAISYARRYSMSAMLGIVVDEDDDAEATKPKSTPVSTSQKPKENPLIKKILDSAKKMGYSSQQLAKLSQDKFDKISSKELTEEQLQELMEAVSKGEGLE
jgi:hypothetical protein